MSEGCCKTLVFNYNATPPSYEIIVSNLASVVLTGIESKFTCSFLIPFFILKLIDEFDVELNANALKLYVNFYDSMLIETTQTRSETIST